MLIPRDSVARALCFATAVTMGTALTAQAEVAHVVKATVVRRGSSLHTSLANQDVYFLRVMPRRGQAFEAIAVDNYPGYAAALPLRDLNKDVTFSIKLVRTPYCDRPAVNDEGIAIRCFAIDRAGWKAPKNVAADLWWR